MMLIQGSVFGAMSDPNQWGQFSCIKPDGTLDKDKYAAYMRMFANDGANCTREPPFLVTDKKWDGPKQRNFLPAVWDDNAGAYDWDHLNPVYFDNLKEMIKIAARHNMAFQFSIFDRCHSLNMPDSPWNLNRLGITGYYQWNHYTKQYVQAVIYTVQNAEHEAAKEARLCRVFFELENEPMNSDFTGTAIETLHMLLNIGFSKDRIEDGVNYFPLKGSQNVVKFNGDELIRSDCFEALKKAKKKEDLYPGADGKDKSRYFSTVHNFSQEPAALEELEEAMKHTRRFSLSDDGEKPKPGAAAWKERLVPILQTKNSHNNIENWKWEHLYRGDLQGNSDFGDQADGVKGISQAYYEVTGRWPENYGKFTRIVREP